MLWLLALCVLFLPGQCVIRLFNAQLEFRSDEIEHMHIYICICSMSRSVCVYLILWALETSE